MVALAIGGFGLGLGLFADRALIGVTLIPALLGTAVIAITFSMLFVERHLERFLGSG